MLSVVLIFLRWCASSTIVNLMGKKNYLKFSPLSNAWINRLRIFQSVWLVDIKIPLTEVKFSSSMAYLTVGSDTEPAIICVSCWKTCTLGTRRRWSTGRSSQPRVDSLSKWSNYLYCYGNAPAWSIKRGTHHGSRQLQAFTGVLSHSSPWRLDTECKI